MFRAGHDYGAHRPRDDRSHSSSYDCTRRHAAGRHDGDDSVASSRQGRCVAFGRCVAIGRDRGGNDAELLLEVDGGLRAAMDLD